MYLACSFIAAGTNHFWHPPFYVAIMPPYLPWHLELVYLSGVAEFARGALMLFLRWPVLAGWGMIALCIAVFPANVHMALHPELFTQFSPQGLQWPSRGPGGIRASEQLAHRTAPLHR